MQRMLQTAVKSQGKTITSSAVCHDSKTKKSNRQSFIYFQENLNEGKWIPSKSWRRSPGLIWCIGMLIYRPRKMVYFRPFSNVISIKTSRAGRKKYLQYGGHPSMTSVQVLYTVCTQLNDRRPKLRPALLLLNWHFVDYL
jgi:hypothetical protein